MIVFVVPLVLALQQRPAQATPAQPIPPATAVQMGYGIEPDTVTVGDPFRLTVRVHAPRGASIQFPAGPDSGAAVDALDPRQERQGSDTTAVDVTATWRIAAWDTGNLPLRFGDIVVKLDNRERRIPLSALTIQHNGFGKIVTECRSLLFHFDLVTLRVTNKKAIQRRPGLGATTVQARQYSYTRHVGNLSQLSLINEAANRLESVEGYIMKITKGHQDKPRTFGEMPDNGAQ